MTSTKLLEGEPLRVLSHKVDTHGRALRWLLDHLDARHAYYLSGKMQVGSKLERVEDLDLYRPADFDGKVLQLHYAREEELRPYLAWWWRRGRYVQVWLRPGRRRWSYRSRRRGGRR